MKYDLLRPCPHCPFRTDIPGYLRPERAIEISQSLARGAPFPCHQTTVDADDDEGNLVATANSQFCAGALLVMEHMEQPNQIVRFAERLGMYDACRLDRTAPVARTLHEFAAHHGGGEEEQECCSVVNQNCEAPAGMLLDGMIVPVEATGETFPCPECGEPVCGACSNDEGVCAYCSEAA